MSPVPDNALPLVLLPGWGMSPRVWDGFLPDWPGPRLTPALPAITSEDIADHANALLARLPERMLLAGWSFGGQIALHIAAHHPQRVARLVLIGTSPRFVASTGEAAWLHGLAANTVASFCSDFAADPAGVQKRFVALQGLGDRARRAVINRLGPALLPVDPANQAPLAAALACLAATDLRAVCAQATQPTLILHGEADALMPADAARWLAVTLPQARLQLLPQCGHAPFVSQADDCRTALETFIHER